MTREAVALVHASVAFDLLPRDRRLGGRAYRLERSFLTVDLHRFVRDRRESSSK